VPGPGTTGNTVHGLLLLHIPADNTVHQQVPVVQGDAWVAILADTYLYNCA